MNKETHISEQKDSHREHAYEVALVTAQVVRKMCLILAVAVPVATILSLIQMLTSHSDWLDIMLDSIRYYNVFSNCACIITIWLKPLVLVPGYMLYQSRLMARLIPFVCGVIKYPVRDLLREHRLGIGVFAGALFPTAVSALSLQGAPLIIGTLLAPVILLMISLPVVIAYVADLHVDDTRTFIKSVIKEMIILACLSVVGIMISLLLSTLMGWCICDIGGGIYSLVR